MLQDHSRNRTPMPAAQPPAGAALSEPGSARVEAGIARMLSAALSGSQQPADPLLAAIAAYREAEAAMNAFSARVEDKHLTADDFAEERVLCRAQIDSRDAVFATPPTTPAGRAALVQLVRDEIAASGTIEGGPPDDDHPIWRDGLRALLAAQEADIRNAAALVLADHETQFLALIPWFARVVPPAEQQRKLADHLYEESLQSVDPLPDGWANVAELRETVEKAWSENGYIAAAELANDLGEPIAKAFEPFMALPMATHPALAWKARLSLFLFNEADATLSDLAAQAVEDWSADAPTPSVAERPHLQHQGSSALIAMVEEWQALLDQINGGGLTDARVEELGGAHDDLQRAIYDFPAASVADLLAKVPVFKDELYDAIGGLDDRFEAKDTLSGAAWLGLFRDFENLACTGPLPTEPSLIDQMLTCWREWSTITDPDRTELEEAEASAALGKRRYALIDAAEALPATIENLSAKALALAWIKYPAIWEDGWARDDYPVDGQLALDIDTAICGRLATEA